MPCNNCGQGCDCRVIAGSGVVVTGTGSQTNPYVISAGANTFTVEDTDCIDLELEGDGTTGDPYVLTADPILDPSDDNLLVCGGNGLLVDCDEVVACVGENVGCGLEFNNGSICVAISEDDGNQIECREDGLFAQFDCDDLGCGLTLDGEGNIAVEVGQPGSTRNGLICDENGVVGICLRECPDLSIEGSNGLKIIPNGCLALDAPQTRDQVTVQHRPGLAGLVPIPSTPANAGIGVGICTTDGAYGAPPGNDQAILFVANPNCYRVQGFVTIDSQFEVRLYPGTDVEVILEQEIDGGGWVARGKLARFHLPAEAFGGDPDVFQLFTALTTVQDVYQVAAQSNRLLAFRLCFRRTATDNGDYSTNFRAEVEAFSITAQQNLHQNSNV